MHPHALRLILTKHFQVEFIIYGIRKNIKHLKHKQRAADNTVFGKPSQTLQQTYKRRSHKRITTVHASVRQRFAQAFGHLSCNVADTLAERSPRSSASSSLTSLTRKVSPVCPFHTSLRFRPLRFTNNAMQDNGHTMSRHKRRRGNFGDTFRGAQTPMPLLLLMSKRHTT